MKLTPKQKGFCQQYLLDLNATQAAIRAGYSKRRAKEIGYQLLHKTTLQAHLKKLMDKRAGRTEVTQDKVIMELAKIAFSDISKFVEFGPDKLKIKALAKLEKEDKACVSEVSKTDTKEGSNLKFKLHNKIQALELLGRHIGAFDDKQSVTGNFKLEIVFGPNGEPIDGPDAGK